MSKTIPFEKYIPTYANDEVCFYPDIRELPFDGEEIVIDRFFIVLCTQGKLSIDIKGIPYEVHANNLVLCKPNDIISNYLFSPSCKYEILTISNSLVHDCLSGVHQLDKLISMTKHPVIIVPDNYLPKFYLYKDLLILKFKEEKTVFNRDIIKFTLRAALYEIIQLSETSVSLNTDYLISRKEVLFKDFIGIISNLSVKPRSVSWYADRLCVSPKHLSNICKMVSGKTAFEWINEYVLKDIYYQLKTSEKSIKEISEYLEFPNTSFFGKYVKTHTGLTPKQYQLQIRSKIE